MESWKINELDSGSRRVDEYFSGSLELMWEQVSPPDDTSGYLANTEKEMTHLPGLVARRGPR